VIVGGAVGGAIGASVVVVLGVLYFRRRRRREVQELSQRRLSGVFSESGETALSEGRVDPFMEQYPRTEIFSEREGLGTRDMWLSTSSATSTSPNASNVYNPLRTGKQRHDAPARVERVREYAASASGSGSAETERRTVEDTLDDDPLPPDPAELRRLWRMLRRIQTESDSVSEAPPRYEEG
jgi:hypothetical protein